MALSKSDYLFRIRVVNDASGKPVLVETISKTAVIEDGKVLSETEMPPVTVKADTPEIIAAVKAFTDVFNVVAGKERAAAEIAAKAAADAAAQAAKTENA